MQKKDKSKNRRVFPSGRNRDGIKLHSPLQERLNFSFLETYNLNKYIIQSVDATFRLGILCLISYNIKFENALDNMSKSSESSKEKNQRENLISGFVHTKISQ